VKVLLVFDKTIAIPGAQVIGAIADKVLNDGTFSGYVDSLIGHEQARKSAQAQHDLTQQTLNGKLSQEQAKESADRITTGRPILTEVVQPLQNRAYDEKTDIAITVHGANRSYLTNNLGVSRRIKIFFNNKEFSYSPAQWHIIDDGICFQIDTRVHGGSLFRNGLNAIQVLAVDGAGSQHQTVCLFYLKSASAAGKVKTSAGAVQGR
jgi:hypothetical protein